MHGSSENFFVLIVDFNKNSDARFLHIVCAELRGKKMSDDYVKFELVAAIGESEAHYSKSTSI